MFSYTNNFPESFELNVGQITNLSYLINNNFLVSPNPSALTLIQIPHHFPILILMFKTALNITLCDILEGRECSEDEFESVMR